MIKSLRYAIIPGVVGHSGDMVDVYVAEHITDAADVYFPALSLINHSGVVNVAVWIFLRNVSIICATSRCDNIVTTKTNLVGMSTNDMKYLLTLDGITGT